MLMDAEESVREEFEELVMRASMLLVCVLGLLFNLTAMVTVRLNPVLRSSFGLLCFSHCIANFGILLLLLFSTTLLTSTGDSKSPNLPAKLCGIIIAVLWYASIYIQVTVSVNRFIAITFAHSNVGILTMNKTIVMVILVWLAGFCQSIPYYWVDTCYFTYDPTIWVWVFADSECGHILSIYGDLYPTAILCTIKILLDISTLVKLRLNRISLFKEALGSNDLIRNAKRRIELRFFIQALVQGLALIYVTISFNLINRLVETKTGMFLTVTLTWASCHAVDGLVVVLFHFRRSYLPHTVFARNLSSLTRIASTTVNPQKVIPIRF